MKGLFSSYTAKIILANVFAFLLFLILQAVIGIESVASLFWLQPAALFSGKNVWTIVTSMFLHANFMHLFVNMFSLFFVGSFVEKLIGKKRFLIFYILSGIFAGVFFALLSYFFGAGLIGAKIFGNPTIYGVGASGAIFGLLGILAVLTPHNRVFLLAGPIIAIIAGAILEVFIKSPGVANVLSIAVSIYIVISIFLIFSPNPKMRRFAVPLNIKFWLLPFIAIIPLIVIGLFIPLPIGNIAHLGGLLAGLAYGFYLIKKYPKRAAMISRAFSR